MTTRAAIVAGVVIGVIYTLSPLTVLALAALWAMVRWTGKEFIGAERRWFFSVMLASVGAKLLMVALLFLTADGSQPFGTFFGDEQIFKTRSIWLRNIGLGIPISGADVIYAFDETGMSGHLYVLAYLQALVGDAPYGMHLFNITLYTASVLALFRLVRGAFGRVAAMGGLLVLSLFPSLFFWSLSALKEPVYAFLATVELLAAVAIVRAKSWPLRIAAALAVVVLGYAMEDVRKGTFAVAMLGTVTGITASAILQRPRLAMVAGVVAPVLLVFAVTRPAIESRALTVIRESVRYHAGHVMSPGVAYKNVDGRYYRKWDQIFQIGPAEGSAYVIRSAFSYFAEPRPANWQSPYLQAYLPEHLVWLLLIVLVPVGIVAGLKRDVLVTSLMLAHAAAIIMMVALTSGNIGTLVRHRGTSLTYLAWLSALGAATLLAGANSRREKGGIA